MVSGIACRPSYHPFHRQIVLKMCFSFLPSQAIAVATLGTAADAQKLDTLRDSTDAADRFYLQVGWLTVRRTVRLTVMYAY